MAARGHLQAVQTVTIPETGEILTVEQLVALQAEVEKLRADRKNLERDLRAKRRRITELERDRVRERLDHPRYKDAVRVATYWWRKCRASNPRVNYKSADRIDAVLALMDIEEIAVDEETGKRRRKPHYTMEQFKAAVDGAAFDPWQKPRKNGTLEKFDDLKTICKSAASFDSMISRCPKRKPELCPACRQPADHGVLMPDLPRAEVDSALSRAV